MKEIIKLSTLKGFDPFISSVIGGGKFANGARSAAFVHLFNSETTDALENIKNNPAYLTPEQAMEMMPLGAGKVKIAKSLTTSMVKWFTKTRAGKYLFRRGSFLNRGKRFRIGIHRHNGRYWFRASGNWVRTKSGHYDMVDLGPIKKGGPWAQ